VDCLIFYVLVEKMLALIFLCPRTIGTMTLKTSITILSTLFFLCLSSATFADEPDYRPWPPVQCDWCAHYDWLSPEIPNRCDLDCFHGLIQAYAEEHDVTIPRSAVLQRFQEADANGNGTLGRQERIRLGHEFPYFFRPYWTEFQSR
jgi:hypothetical protein